jgi:hypothetical protein
MDNMRRAVQIREGKIENSMKKDSRARLNESISRKFRTTFIGSLSIFEEKFGKLWGNKIPQHLLNDREREFRKAWEETRNLILNNGNNQLRAAQMEISEYCVEWNRHKMDFIMEDAE